MSVPLVSLRGILLSFGGSPLLAGVDLSVSASDRICLVGRNGCGKSTLLRIAAGLVEPDRGEVFLHPDAVVAYLPQEADLSGYSRTLDYVEGGLGPNRDRHRARQMLESLGLTGSEPVTSLSGGEARRVALARALAVDPDVLLLDEPTNHLDLPTIVGLETTLRDSRAALVVVSHDRRFLASVSRSIVWLDRGTARRLERGFDQFEAWRDSILEQEEIDRHKLDRKIAREDEWMHGGVTARRKRNVRRVSELQRLRQERRAARRAEGQVRFTAHQSGPSGRLVIEAAGISKSFGDQAVVRDFSIKIARGDRIGIVGSNGAGKTTLLQMLTGRLAPDAGEVRLGTGLDMATLDQHRDELAPDMTVREALTRGRGDTLTINGQSRHVASYMKDFLFQPAQARSPLSVLSGGERARLMLARALARPSNLLVLDEPTNDLDLETLDLLQELVADYPGTVLLVSHDRDFLNRVVTSVVASEGDGSWIEYAGGYSDMLAQRGDDVPEKPAARTEPSRPKSEAVKPSGDARGARRRKLSFNEMHALKTLPGAIETLTARIAVLQADLSDPTLYSRDPAAFAAASQELARVQSELTEAENRWLEIEILREELEGPDAH